ncbi:hypothetical protein LCH21_03480 [Patescibacteria group bacterium]|jgi:hypothetical protein|nr:hypothetical protein [Patescibacteria group bacterium]
MTTKKKQTKKSQSNVWFRQLRGSYIPIHWKGWLTYVPYIAYLYFTYMLLVPNRPLPDTILFLIPYWVAGVIIMHWVAKQKS